MAPRSQQRDYQIREDAKSIVPAGSPEWITAELIEATLRTWQPYYKEVLTPEDAVEILRNVSHLYQVLSSDRSLSADLNLELKQESRDG